MTIYLPNFEIDSQKFLYVDIWNLAVSPDGSNVFTAKDNECIVADFCNVLNPYTGSQNPYYASTKGLYHKTY